MLRERTRNVMIRRCLIFAALLFLLPAVARADTFYPMVMAVTPVAVQAGYSTDCEFTSRYSLQGAYKVFVTGDGVTGEVLPPGPKPAATKLTVRFTAAADALPGLRDVRLATPQGASTLGQIVVVRDPVVREAAGDNNSPDKAQPVTLPAAICGAIERAEDVDCYKFTAVAGAELTFHVWCQRLANKIHDLQEVADPILTLRSAAGAVLGTSDNVFAADPLLHVCIPAAGEYVLEIRDVRYGGNPNWTYCIEASDRPFITHVHPLGVAPGSTTELHLTGYHLPGATAKLTLPADTPEGPRWVTLPLAGGQRSNPVPVVVCKLPAVREAGEHPTPSTAQPIPVPAAVSGAIAAPGEADCYAFEAKAGEKLSFEVVASRQQSPLDSVLRVLGDKGAALTENDDFRDRWLHSDSLVENWTAPAAGRYVLEVRDVHSRGGPEFVYLLKVRRAEPHFTLEVDTDKTPLAPGTAGVIFVRVDRKEGFAGEVQIAIDGLPKGVTASCGRILAGGRDGCIILKAAADAPQGAANVRITGTAGKLSAVARPLQEWYVSGGGRGHYPVEMHTVSVGTPLDIRAVRLSTTDVTLKPGESKAVDVAIERAPGFSKNVTLDVLMQHLGSVYGNSLPPGVTLDDRASQTVLAGGQTKGRIVLKAAADAAPVERQQVPVLAHVAINFVMKMTYAGEPLSVTVRKP